MKLLVDSAMTNGHDDRLAPAETETVMSNAKDNSDGTENSMANGHSIKKDGATPMNIDENTTSSLKEATEWVVVAEMRGAHGVFEVNHVCWAPRADRNKKLDEEIIISSGDDGVVKVWTLDV